MRLLFKSCFDFCGVHIWLQVYDKSCFVQTTVLSVVSLPWPKSLSLTQQPETNKNPKNIISNIFFLERTGAPATTFACRALSYSFLFDLLFISLCYTPLFGSLRPICHLFRPVNQFFFPLTASYCVSFTFHFARKFNSIQISFINGFIHGQNSHQCVSTW